MSLEIEIRDEIAYRFLSNGFRQFEAMDWALEVYAENQYIKKSKNPRKLVSNAMTMGGEGDQKQMNITAFGHAFARYSGEARAEEAAKTKMIEQAAKEESIQRVREINVLRDRMEKAQQDFQEKLLEEHRKQNEKDTKIQELQAKVNDLEKQNITLQLTGSVEMPDALKVEGHPVGV